jgi:hypothetical protein
MLAWASESIDMARDRRFVLVAFGCCVALFYAGQQRRLLAKEPASVATAAWVKEQMADGRLTVEFYDPLKQPRPFPGWTDFEFRLEYQYKYRVESLKSRKAARGTVVLFPTFTKVEVPVKNRILLPATAKSERWYEGALARHELEHVRIGTHPRLMMLGKHLVNKVNRIESTVETISDATPDWVAARLEDAITPRRDALQALVAGINRKVDKDTNHGQIPLPNLEEFLANLYLKEHLDEMKFTYLAEVLDLVGTPEYQMAVPTQED